MSGIATAGALDFVIFRWPEIGWAARAGPVRLAAASPCSSFDADHCPAGVVIENVLSAQNKGTLHVIRQTFQPPANEDQQPSG
jgi:hypothetical protein